MKYMNARAGFALPLTMLLLLVVTGSVMLSLEQGSSERRVQDTDTGVLQALVLAESGLERFASEGDDWTWSNGYPVPLQASSTAELTDLGEDLGISGFAEIEATRLWAQGNPADPDAALFAISSRGVQTQGGWSNAPQAARVVSRLVHWERPVPPFVDESFPSAWTSISGLTKNGNSGTITGIDACGKKGAKAGVAVPADPGYNGHEGPVTGEPPIEHIGDTAEEAADAIDIPWKDIREGTAFPPTFTIPHDGGWSDIESGVEGGWDSYPVIFVDSDAMDDSFTLPTDGGKGTLIVTGDAEISGQNLWEGIVLVGGKLTSNGNNTVSGAVVSGLNVKLDDEVGMGEVGVADVGNGTKTFEYDSCAIESALNTLNANPPANVTVLANTWLDTWAQY